MSKNFARLISSDEYESLKNKIEKHIVHRKIADMYIVVSFVPKDVAELSSGSIEPGEVIRLGGGGLGFEKKVVTSALSNTLKINPPKLYIADDWQKINLILGSDGSEYNGIGKMQILSLEGCLGRCFKLTTAWWHGGAIAIFYPGLAQIIGKKLGEDYYVAFPSLNEARIYPISSAPLYEVRESVAFADNCTEDGNLATWSGSTILKYSSYGDDFQKVAYEGWKGYNHF